MRFLPPLDIVLRVPLLPVLILQGARIRKTAQLLPEAIGPRSGVDGDGPPLSLLFVGDSSAAGVGVHHQNKALAGQTVSLLARKHRVSWTLVARTGATAKTVQDLVRAELGPGSEGYDIAVIVLGVNDSARLSPKWIWRRRTAVLRAMLKDTYGARHLIVTGIPPMQQLPILPPVLAWVLGSHARRLDQALANDLAKEANVRYVDFDLSLAPTVLARDGFHPNAQGYKACAERLVKCILNIDQG